MRLGLLGDTHGYVPALETAIQGCRKAGVDLIVHCGDCIYGNGEVYLAHWGTPQWSTTLEQRLRRPDSADHFLHLVPEGQPVLSPADLGWLRQLPGELLLSCARENDVYVCHAMPGDPFSTVWDASTILSSSPTIAYGTDPTYSPEFGPGEIEEVLSRPEVAGADLILCGHVPYPLVLRTPLPSGRFGLVVRGTGWIRGEPDGSGWMVDFWILENVGPPSLGFQGWTYERRLLPFHPRDPSRER